LQIFSALSPLPSLAGCVVTAGTFDGVHLGHQAILAGVVGEARRRGVASVVVTYHPHPRLVLFPEQTDLRLLSTQQEKAQALAAAGVDVLLVLPFTLDFAQWTYTEYVDRVIVQALKAGVFVLGFDHQFGKGRAGSFATLEVLAQERGFQLEEIPPHMVSEATVSSSKIRHALQAGDVETAAKFLGRPYGLEGTVVHGQKLGRTLGFPTLNLDLADPLKLLPAASIYAVEVVVKGQVYAGALSLGNNPTVEGKGWSCEVHVLDFAQDVYGEMVQVRFFKRLRGELKFDSLDALKEQIGRDVAAVRAWWGDKVV
jgi:riboflavin kinase/FMN adenylyltransferase